MSGGSRADYSFRDSPVRKVRRNLVEEWKNVPTLQLEGLVVDGTAARFHGMLIAEPPQAWFLYVVLEAKGQLVLVDAIGARIDRRPAVVTTLRCRANKSLLHTHLVLSEVEKVLDPKEMCLRPAYRLGRRDGLPLGGLLVRESA